MSHSPTESSPFWRFSLALYGRPHVAEACLELQDQAGIDVNVLLFLLWRASMRQSLGREEVSRLEDAVDEWRSEVVRPLRSVRRFLKTPPVGFGVSETAELREQVKRQELRAEYLQQAAMFAVSDELAGMPGGTPAECFATSLDACRPDVAAGHRAAVARIAAELEAYANSTP